MIKYLVGVIVCILSLHYPNESIIKDLNWIPERNSIDTLACLRIDDPPTTKIEEKRIKWKGGGGGGGGGGMETLLNGD